MIGAIIAAVLLLFGCSVDHADKSISPLMRLSAEQDFLGVPSAERVRIAPTHKPVSGFTCHPLANLSVRDSKRRPDYLSWGQGVEMDLAARSVLVGRRLSVRVRKSDFDIQIISGRHSEILDVDQYLIIAAEGVVGELGPDSVNTNVGPELFFRGFASGFYGLLGNLHLTTGGIGVLVGDSKGFDLVLSRPSTFAPRPALKHQIEPVTTPGLSQGSVSLHDRYDQADDRSEAEKGRDDRRYSCEAGFLRCFFSSEGGPPLSAQIGGVVILSIIAGVGIAFGIGPVGRLRRWGWRGSPGGRAGALLCVAACIWLFSLLLSAS